MMNAATKVTLKAKTIKITVGARGKPPGRRGHRKPHARQRCFRGLVTLDGLTGLAERAPNLVGERMAQAATIVFEVDGKALQVERVQGTVTLSEPFRFTFDALDTAAGRDRPRTSRARPPRGRSQCSTSSIVPNGVVSAAERVVVARAARYVVSVESAVVAPLSIDATIACTRT